MPVMPANARTVITIFAVSRTAISVVSRCATSAGGCLIWTPMKIDPATAAAAPAALVRPLLVMVMGAPGSSWFCVPDRLSGDRRDARRRLGDATSHDDVIGLVTA